MKKLEFDDDNDPFVGSDIDILLKTDYLRHKTSTVKKGTSVILVQVRQKSWIFLHCEGEDS